MIKENYRSLLAMVLVGIMALFISTEARAAQCPDGTVPGESAESVDADNEPSGWTVTTCVDAREESFGDFPVSYQAGDAYNPCQNKQHESIACRGFAYLVDAPDTGNPSLSQVAVLIPSGEVCGEGNEITLLMKDRGVKIREYEPSTNFGKENMQLDTLTCDSLKLGPANQETLSAQTSPAAAVLSTMELKTDSGLHYVSIPAPGCCAITHIGSRRNFVTGGVVPTVVEYDICTGVASTPTLKICSDSNEPCVTDDECSNGTCGVPYELVHKAKVCQGDLDFGVDNSECTAFNKLGGNDGAVVNACVDGKNWVHFGYGPRIYRINTGDDCNTLGAPAASGGAATTCDVEVVYDDTILVRKKQVCSDNADQLCASDADCNEDITCDVTNNCSNGAGSCSENDDCYEATCDVQCGVALEVCTGQGFLDCDIPVEVLNGSQWLCSTTDKGKGKVEYDCGYITYSYPEVPGSNGWWWSSTFQMWIWY